MCVCACLAFYDDDVNGEDKQTDGKNTAPTNNNDDQEDDAIRDNDGPVPPQPIPTTAMPTKKPANEPASGTDDVEYYDDDADQEEEANVKPKDPSDPNEPSEIST